MRVVLIGGPSGGHSYPALALGEALYKVDASIQIHIALPERLFFPLDEKKISYAEIHRFPGRGLNLKKPWQIPLLLIEWGRFYRSMWRFLDHVNPSAIVSFGTFLVIPAAFWAKKRQVRMIAHEQNFTLGRANRLISRFVPEIALGMSGNYRDPVQSPESRFQVYGQVVRQTLMERAETGRNKYAKESGPFSILILGGSQGSRRVNDLVFRALEIIPAGDCEKLLCLHIVGPKDREKAQQFYATHDIRNEIFTYVAEMETLYSKAHLVIGRAGAGTLAEVSAFKLPFICVPFPSRHQRQNASYLKHRNAALVIEDGHDAERELAGAILGILHDEKLREELGQHMAAAVPHNGLVRLMDWVLSSKKEGHLSTVFL